MWYQIKKPLRMFKFSYLCRSRDSISPMVEIRESRRGRTFNRSVVPLEASASVIMSNESEISNYFEHAKRLTLKAGEIFKCGFDGQKVVSSKDHEWDLVTNYDKKIEEILIEGLKTEFPDHEFIGEETTASAKTEPVLTDKPTWIIDPIDGTINYVNSFPFTCISVALTVCKEIVVGIIYNPLASELYTAIKGQGAFLNGEPMKTSQVTELKKATIEVALFSLRASKNRDVALGRIDTLVRTARGVRCMGSAAMALAYVARGALDCFQMDKLQPWDVAAGVLLIREAGGTVIDTKEDEYNLMKPNTIAAANDTLAMEVKALVVENDLKVMRKRLTKS